MKRVLILGAHGQVATVPADLRLIAAAASSLTLQGARLPEAVLRMTGA